MKKIDVLSSKNGKSAQRFLLVDVTYGQWAFWKNNGKNQVHQKNFCSKTLLFQTMSDVFKRVV